MLYKYNCHSRYLSAKKTLDDRSLNRYVWEQLRIALPTRPLRILEIGAGIGTMIERVIEWGLIERASYHAIDTDATAIKVLEHRVGKLDLGEVVVSAETIDIFDYIRSQPEPYDLLIAHHFLDLLPLADALPPLLSLLKPNGYFYFTLNFDGTTAFEPSFDAAFDNQIEQLYHANMDMRSSGGDSRSGRHLLQFIRDAGATVIAAGGSDWIVHVAADGEYIADEAYFLHAIVEMIGNALADHADLDAMRFAEWVRCRHEQIDRGELMYIAHQLDVFGRK